MPGLRGASSSSSARGGGRRRGHAPPHRGGDSVKRLWIAIAVLGSIAGPVWAADVFEKVGTFDGQFLKIGIGARAAGMGGAFVAVADDPSAVFWNPAGLARLDEDKTAVMVNHNEWPSAVNVDQATLVFHVK